MTLRDDIQTALRQVITDLGETWQYRRRTSGPSSQTVTYGSYANVVVHASGRSAPQEFEEDSRTVNRMERMRVRVSDALADLYAGDQFKDPDNVVWAVVGIGSNAPGTGTVAYEVERTVPVKADGGNRGGGI
jgi:hypothetical protein